MTVISVACPSCNKSLKAPASAAGKRGTCSRCGAKFLVPAAPVANVPGSGRAVPPPAPKAPPKISFDDLDDFLASEQPPAGSVSDRTAHPSVRSTTPGADASGSFEAPRQRLIVESRVLCPFCAEPIHRTARKCRHCGEFLDGSSRDRGDRDGRPVIVNVNAASSPVLENSGGAVGALLSFLIPGLGQMVQGRVGVGVLWLVATMVGYMMLILPGFILHVVCIVDAARGVQRIAAPPASRTSHGRLPRYDD